MKDTVKVQAVIPWTKSLFGDGTWPVARIEAPWSERAREWIERLPPGEEFTAEALRRSIGEPPEANAIGAVVMRASKQRLITYAGRDERSERSVARGRWVRRWRRTEREAT